MDVSTDESQLIYSSITPTVHLVDLETLSSRYERIHFYEQTEDSYDEWFGIMSMKFSGNNQEIVAGTNRNQIMVYDLAANRLDVSVAGAHTNDVNSVVFANREHSNIMLSGSDDCFIKVWDRRALGSN